jgi:solute carrier family 25 folate transporter 32
MRIIWREEGFRGLYRGLGPTIIGYLPTWAIYFTVYDAVKAKLADSRPSQYIHTFFPRVSMDSDRN